MTAAPHSPLVERVARAICQAENVNPDGIGWAMTAETKARLPLTYPFWQYRVPAAQAALDACHAEEVKEVLKAVMGELWWCAVQAGFDWKDAERRKVSSVGRAYDAARALLAKLEGLP